jgi:hypothetical protein
MANLDEIHKKELQADIIKVSIQTEMGGNSANLYQFSFASLGDSTYSFGALQFDVGARKDARNFLRNNGFTQAEVALLSKKEKMPAKDLEKLNKKLAAISSKVDQLTIDSSAKAANKIDLLISYVEKNNKKIAKIIKEDKRVQLALADYDNQFNLGGLKSDAPEINTMLAYLCGNEVNLAGGKIKLRDTISVSDIQNFIDRTTYGSQEKNKAGVETRKKALGRALDKIAPVQTTPALQLTPAG